jgi:Cation efflux family
MSTHDDYDHPDHDHGAHGHRQGPGHAHAPADFGRAFAVAAVLNIALVVAQIVYGVMANSVALLADAGHNFGDVLGLLLAWGAHSLAQRQPTARYTYGFRSASILAALLNSLILLVATGAIAWEAVRRGDTDPPLIYATGSPQKRSIRFVFRFVRGCGRRRLGSPPGHGWPVRATRRVIRAATQIESAISGAIDVRAHA